MKAILACTIILATQHFVGAVEKTDAKAADAQEKQSPKLIAKVSWPREKKDDGDGIVWGEPQNGLAIGVRDIRTSFKSPMRPIIRAYLENRGDLPVMGILSRARFTLELDKQFYAEARFGGPVSVIEPGKRVGPILLTTDHFYQVKSLALRGAIDQTKPQPNLAVGMHTLRIHYELEQAEKGKELASSKTLSIAVTHSPYPTDEAVSMLVKELESANRDVRRSAALAVGKLRLRGCVDALAATLKDADKTLRRYAVDSLGKIGDPKAADALRPLLDDPAMGVRLAAAQSLVKLGVRFNTDWVEPIIASKDRLVFQNAIWTVRRHGGEQAVPVLIRCLEFDNPSVDNYYNYTLVWQIHACGGPDFKYKHDFDAKGTPEQIKHNRHVLSRLMKMLKEKD